ncbi:MAG: cation:proton antiporter [Candidatus Anstonellaceae archaeon]
MEPAFAVGISITVIMLFALLFERLGMPLILGVLIAGMLVGPYSPLAGTEWMGFNFNSLLISNPATVEVFAVIGSALILFGIGLEFSIIRLTQSGVLVFLATALKIGLAYIITNSLMLMIGFPAPTATLIAIAISFSSTPIIVKLLESAGKIRRPETLLVFSIIVIEDLLTVFILGLIARPPTQSEYAVAISLIRVIATFVFAYLVLLRIISRFLSMISHSDELLILGTVSLVLMIGYISEMIGLSFSVGAFLAGSTIAGSFESRKIEEKIKPFNFLFASFFFFSIGLMINLFLLFSNMLLLLVFLFVALVIRFISAGISSYFAGFSGRSASLCSAAMLPVSELSLLLISQGVADKILQSQLLGVFGFSIISSSFLSSWLLNKENEIYNVILRLSPPLIIKNMRIIRMTILGMRRAFTESSRYYRVVEKLPSISQISSAVSTREQLTLTSKNAAIAGVLSLFCFAGIFLMQDPAFSVIGSFFIFLFLLFFFFSTVFLVNLYSSFSGVSKMLGRSGSGQKYEVLIYALSAFSFLMLSAFYALAYMLAPPSLSIILSLPSFAFAARSILLGIKAFSLGARL